MYSFFFIPDEFGRIVDKIDNEVQEEVSVLFCGWDDSVDHIIENNEEFFEIVEEEFRLILIECFQGLQGLFDILNVVGVDAFVEVVDDSHKLLHILMIISEWKQSVTSIVLYAYYKSWLNFEIDIEMIHFKEK